ncbi:hypothetical protein BCR44DRAFT_1437935, partial [Catenaria anguillulae PL171]
ACIVILYCAAIRSTTTISPCVQGATPSLSSVPSFSLCLFPFLLSLLACSFVCGLLGQSTYSLSCLRTCAPLLPWCLRAWRNVWSWIRHLYPTDCHFGPYILYSNQRKFGNEILCQLMGWTESGPSCKGLTKLAENWAKTNVRNSGCFVAGLANRRLGD